MKKCVLGWAPCRAPFIEMSFNCSLNQQWCIALSGAGRQLKLNCVCATVNNPSQRKQVQPLWLTERYWLYLDKHSKFIFDKTHATLISASAGGLRLQANQHRSASEVTEDLQHKVVIFGPFPPSCFSSWVALSYRKPFQLGRADRIKGRAETLTHTHTHMLQKTQDLQQKHSLPALTRRESDTDHTQATALLGCGSRGAFMGMYC